MKNLTDLTGQIFGRLTLLEKVSIKGRPSYLCECQCGTRKIIYGNSITTGRTTSCGCYNKETAKFINYKDGEWSKNIKSPEYRCWQNIKGRCYNPKRECYSDYGAKGICVSELWLNDFNRFLKDVGRRPSEKHTLDRYPNASGNYEPGNVRWATRKEQSRNYVNRNIWIEHNGERMVLMDWAIRLNVSTHFISYWIKRNKSICWMMSLIKDKASGSFDKSKYYSSRYKISNADREDILKSDLSLNKLANLYKVSKKTIFNIKNKKVLIN